MILHLYFARKFAFAVLGVAAVFFAILLLIDMVEQLRDFESEAVTLAQAAGLAALNVPDALYRILPLVVMLATLALFRSLARSSELVVARAAGRSALHSVAAPVAAAVGLGLVTVAVLNPIVAATSQRFETVATRFEQGGASTLSIGEEGIWLRQGGADGQTVIRAGRADLDGTELFDVTFIAFGPDGGVRARVQAGRARLTDGAWHLTDAKRWRLGPDVANPEASAERRQSMTLATDLTRARIRDSFGTPAAIPIWELPGFIAGLERAGFSAQRHKVWLQMELALPAVFAAMVLIGAAFTMRPARGGAGTMVLAALGIGIAVYFLRNFAQVLGENDRIPAALAAWSPPAAAILLALALLLHLEDG